MSKIELVVFDWSGTISDDRGPVLEATNRVLESHHKPRITIDDIARNYSASPDAAYRKLGITEGTGEELNAEYRRNLKDVTEEGILPVIYPDAKKVLDYLHSRGKRLVVVSSHPTSNLDQEAIDYGLEVFLELTIGDSMDKVQDLISLSHWSGVAPRNAIYCGDTIVDMTAAKKAGFRPIAVKTGYQTEDMIRAEHPEITILSCLSEMMDGKVPLLYD